MKKIFCLLLIVLLLFGLTSCGTKTGDVPPEKVEEQEEVKDVSPDTDATEDSAEPDESEEADGEELIVDMEVAISTYNLDTQSSDEKLMSDVRLPKDVLYEVYDTELTDFDKHPSNSMTYEDVVRIVGANPSCFFAINDGEERIFRWFTEETDAAYISVNFKDIEENGEWKTNGFSDNIS